MQTANFNAQLKNVGQATTAQLATFINLKEERVLLTAAMENGFLKINYRTKGGRFVSATFDQYGQPKEKKYFHNWNETDNEPFNPIIFA